jgi:hypothetical protein
MNVPSSINPFIDNVRLGSFEMFGPAWDFGPVAWSCNAQTKKFTPTVDELNFLAAYGLHLTTGEQDDPTDISGNLRGCKWRKNCLNITVVPNRLLTFIRFIRACISCYSFLYETKLLLQLQAALGATVSVEPGNASFVWRKELLENENNNFFLSFFRLCKATSFWKDAHERYSIDNSAELEEKMRDETFRDSQKGGLDFLAEDEYRKMFK